ncbi:hypothetical protein ACJMK2_019261 [Sinanodonta woodiana]|uniref:Uncharacterized protein n=1 Tax=Sinanodonta woodiana TaxID=1069815 RepID=A0ABD3UJW4_SINWO
MDEVDGTIYLVSDRPIVSEVGKKLSNSPMLHPGYVSQNLPHDMECPDRPNPLAVISQDNESVSSFHSSSSSSDHSDDDKHGEKQWGLMNQQRERPHKVKSRESQLFINGKTRVCEIKSFTYYYKDEKIKQHYIIRIERSTDIMGDTGLSPKRSASQDIRTGPVRSISQDIHTGPVQSTILTMSLDLQLQPARGSSRSIVRRKEEETEYEQALPKGNVTDITFKNNGTACIKVLATKRSYLLASDNGSIRVGLLDNNESGLQSKSKFDITPFQGKDDSAMPDERWVFGYIIHLTVDGVTRYMARCPKTSDNRLVFQFDEDRNLPLTNYPDESFFLIHEYGDRTILESMLYRGNCVHFDAASNSLNLQPLDMTCIGSMTDDKCGEFILNIFRTDVISERLRHFFATMSCLLPI